ncbi:hypothetical protein BCR43DRAFT_500391 [Syncephalastrum racemosum]|uniref:Homeobox domain-containing protein n=1 Tax=Syncephalastrum racemosum TaxID=13706 RepID=A0A1X2HRW4_SYNRA|nr:hypothetical protein BCR43DRAFT_500391 [Syncephalastrum racemosum]
MATTRNNPSDCRGNNEHHTYGSESHLRDMGFSDICRGMKPDDGSSESGGESNEDNTADYVRRQRFSTQELKTLDGVFRMCKFPSREVKLNLAEKLHTSPRRIQTWFQNKRAALRRAEERYAVSSSFETNDSPYRVSPPPSSSSISLQEPDAPLSSMSGPSSVPNVLEPVPLSDPTEVTLKMRPESPYRAHPLLSHDYHAGVSAYNGDNSDTSL